MARRESSTRQTINFTPSPRQNSGQHVYNAFEQGDATQNERPRQQSQSNQTRILVCCLILNLPIWGFAMTYGIFQEYFFTHWKLKGSKSSVGVIGLTFNGVMYMSMPLLFALFNRRWAHRRRLAALIGLVIACLSFALSALSTAVWHLIITQGVLAAVAGALLYSPTTIALSEAFTTDNRTLAYGLVLSGKSVIGATCPFLMQALLTNIGLRKTLWIWTAITAASSLAALIVMPLDPPATAVQYRPRRISWEFFKHSTVHVYSIATLFQSSGYGIAQSYLNSYARTEAQLSSSSSTLLLTLFNIPGIFLSNFIGILSDNKWYPVSATATTSISAITSALAAFFLWGFAGASPHEMVMLVLFAIIYGGFAGAYSATWGTVIKQMEAEAAERNEAVDSGIIYGILNGARGIGFVGGGLAGVKLLGTNTSVGMIGQGTGYGPLILYIGLSTAVGGCSVLLKGRRLFEGLKSWSSRIKV